MKFIYVGRLDREKGIETLIYCIKKLCDISGIHFHIYGKGEHTNNIKDLACECPNIVSHHGRQDKTTISQQRSECDFFIMPSIFLETFGLTACESLLLGVPVIGNKKGGLVPFIDDRLNIQAQIGSNDNEKLFKIIKKLINNKNTTEDYNELIQKTQQSYTKQQRYENINNIIKNEQSIIMISDFINYNGGGIETHIHDSKDILTQYNKNISLHGHQAPSGKRSHIQKLWTMGRSIANLYDSIIISRIIKKNKVGLIRRHSISRAIGRFPLMVLGHVNKNITQCITYHELGLFHPYPSKVINIEQLPKARSLFAFIQAGQESSFYKKIAIAGKFILIRLIHKQLQKHIDTHIVPSEWMIPIIKKRHPHAHVICIPHFVSLHD